ncbi:hypothetical protein CXF38_06160 [Corynebacterium bovis]|nr:hypothetical protein CXF38_06160 [Corynebacterium bovis]
MSCWTNPVTRWVPSAAGPVDVPSGPAPASAGVSTTVSRCTGPRLPVNVTEEPSAAWSVAAKATIREVVGWIPEVATVSATYGACSTVGRSPWKVFGWWTRRPAGGPDAVAGAVPSAGPPVDPFADPVAGVVVRVPEPARRTTRRRPRRRRWGWGRDPPDAWWPDPDSPSAAGVEGESDPEDVMRSILLTGGDPTQAVPRPPVRDVAGEPARTVGGEPARTVGGEVGGKARGE